MSARFTAAELAALTGGELVRGGPEQTLEGATLDSRSVAPGQLFVAIRGPRHDGHDHAAAAARAGARGLLVRRGFGAGAELPDSLVVVEVEDTTRALARLARGIRERFRGPVVGITGSSGKTSTKEMCAAILEAVAPCLRNPGNLNNQFGLPLSLLGLDAEHRFAVVELGMNHRGEIAALAEIARPDVGVLLNVGPAHIEHLGSLEAIAEEKGDLLARLPAGGRAVVNADDPRALAQAQRSPARVLRFGRSPGADVRAALVRPREGGYRFELQAPEGTVSVEVAGLAPVTVDNALAAAAAALAAGAPLSAVGEGLARFRGVPGRFEARRLRAGVTLVDDSYNANPRSVAEALRAVADRRGSGRAFAVLGTMGELGAEAPAAHREVGALAARLGLDGLVALGEHAEALAAGAAEAGVPAHRIRVAKGADEAADWVASELGPGDWVLVKGSRAARMERVVEALAALWGAA